MIEALRHWLQRQTEGCGKQETRCLCCGECCESFGGHLNASSADLERWRSQGREDLLRRVNRLGWIWVDPETGRLEERCPFILRLDGDTAICGIQQTKPDICRDYPTLAHGRRCLHGRFLRCLVPLLGGVAGEVEAVAALLQ